MWLLVAACATPSDLPARVESPDDPSAALPMVVILHGLGGSPTGMAELVESCELPVRIVALQAPIAHGDGWSWFPTTFGPTGATADPAVIRHAADGVADAIRAMTAARKVVGEPIVTGFSQGGMLSFTLAATHPELLSAALPLAGRLPADTPITASADPVIAFHGRDDEIVRFADGEDGVRRLVAGGVPAELHAYDRLAHRIRDDLRRDWCDTIRRLLPPPPPGTP